MVFRINSNGDDGNYDKAKTMSNLSHKTAIFYILFTHVTRAFVIPAGCKRESINVV